MRSSAALLLLALPLAACTPRDPQRADAYAEMNGTALPDTAHAAAGAADAHGAADSTDANLGSPYTAEAMAQYDAAASVPQPNLNTRAMRGMPLPDTATRGWAATGRQHRQHAAPGTAEGAPKVAPAGAQPGGADPSGTATGH